MRNNLGILILLCSAAFINSQQVAVVVLNYTCNSMVSVYEGSQVTICAILTFINGSQVVPLSVGVLFNETNGTAVSGVNYFATSIYQTFAVGSTVMQNVCVTIQTIDDMIVAPSKTFTVNLYPSDSLVAVGDRAFGTSVVVTIINIDSYKVTPTPTPTPAPAIVYTVVMNTNSITVNESAGSVQICVTVLNGPVSNNLQVNVQFIQGTATAADYSHTLTKITVNNGASTGCSVASTITVIDDNLIEGGSGSEYFIVQLQNGTSVLVPYNRSSTNVTILENHVVMFGLWSINPTTLLEGSIPLVSICAQILSASPLTLGIPVTVEVKFTGITATYGVDFNPSAVNITFWTGNTFGARNCTNLYIIQDNIIEDNENILISLKSYFSYVGISASAGSAIFTIIEDLDSATVGFTSSIFTATEGVQSSCQICIQLLTGAIGKAVSAYVTTSALGTGQPYVDYTPLNEAEVVFQPGASALQNSTSCINFTIIDDTVVESNETVPLSLSSTLPVITLQASSTATVVIYDPLDYVTIGITGPMFVTEGVNLSATICANILEGALGRSVTVLANTVNFTAIPGVAYEEKSITLTFTTGKITGDSQCFDIAIYRTVIVKDTEFFSVNLTSSDFAVIIPRGYESTIVTIYNDPANKISFAMRNSQYYCKETDEAITVCVVLLSGLLGKELDVAVSTADVTAFGNRDYAPLNTTITFNSLSVQGQSLCIDIDILYDNNVENASEYFYVNLNSVDTVHTLIQIPQASVYIQEDTDDVLVIGFVRTNYSVYESYLATICAVIINGTAERSVSVFASTIPTLAIENVDYIGLQNKELTFPPGSSTDSSVCFSIAINNNTEIQSDRTFSVFLQRTDPAVVLFPAKMVATVTIKLNPIDRVVLGMQDAILIAREGVNTSVILCSVLKVLSGNLTRSVSGQFVVMNSTDKAVQSYIIPTYSIIYPAWSVPGLAQWCIPIFIIDDHVVGDTEHIIIQLTSDDSIVQIDENVQTTDVVILEDDQDYVEVQMQHTSLNVSEENSTITLCAIMTSGALEKSITVNLQTHSITAIDGRDFIGGRFALTFTPGQSATGNNLQCLNILIINDHTLEYDETFIVTLESSVQDTDIVRISYTENTTLVSIIENPGADDVHIGMIKIYYKVVEGEQLFVPICAVLYQGRLERDLTVTLVILNSSLGDTALLGRDYTMQSESLTFKYDESSNTSSSSCVNITIIDDNVPENELYITVGLSVAFNDLGAVFVVPEENETVIDIIDDDHGITIGFNERLIQVTEGVNFSINVCGFVHSLTGIWKGNLTASLIALNSSSSIDANSITNSNILFASWLDFGVTSWCVPVYINDDKSVENTEQFTLQLVSNNLQVEIDVNHSTITININEDSDDYIEIQMQYTSKTVSENISNTTVCAIITSGILGKNVTVIMETHSITALDGKDYIGGQFTLTFASGQSAMGENLQCFDLIIINDHILETNETLAVALNSSRADSDVVRILSTQWELIVTIVDDPNENSIEIGITEVYYEVIEGEQPEVTICAALYQGELRHNLTLLLNILNSSLGDTALPGRDYTLQSQTLTFISNDSQNISSTHCINVVILDNNLPENIRYITIGLIIDSNDIANVPGRNQTIIAILDDDHGIVVGLNNRLLQVTEGVNKTINLCGFLENLTAIWKANLSGLLLITNSSTAEDLEDYILPTSKILFPPRSISGGTMWCQVIFILNDNIVEDSQLLTLQLVSTNPLVVVDENYSTITINITEDANDYIEVQMQYKLLSVSEENTTATVCAMVTVGVLEKSVSVVLQTHSVTAIDGKDYIGGQFILTFTSGQSAYDNSVQCISLIVLNDNTLENNETVLITLNATQQDAGMVRISNAHNELLLTIIEDPSSDIVEIGMVQGYYEVVEGQQPSVTICAAVYQGKLGFDVVVLLTIVNSSLGDTATPGCDYTLNAQTLIFIYNELNNINNISCVNLTILEDNIPENEQYITIGLFNENSNIVIIPSRNQTTIAILDGGADFVIKMQYSQYVVDETVGLVAICVVAVDSSPSMRKNVTFIITTNGTATAGLDYIVQDSVTVDSSHAKIGDIFCFNVTIIDDNAVGNDLYLYISLDVHDSNARILPNNSTSVVKIMEDTIDYVNIGFQQTQYTIYDWINSSLNICIQLTEGSLERDVTVKVGTETTSNTTAIPGENYLPLLENITFTSNGHLLLCINLTILTHHSSSEKTLALFLSTEERAVHLTRNTTLVKIDSQSNVSVLLTPRGTVIIVTIWVVLLPLCCLLFMLCWLLVCKKKRKWGKRDKVHPAITKHDLELVSAHDRTAVVFDNKLITTHTLKNDMAAKASNDSSTSVIETIFIYRSDCDSAQLY